jgi:hypothetical protein
VTTSRNVQYHAAMVITTQNVDILSGGATMRMFVAAPKAPGKYPGIVCYSDIFQLTGTMLRRPKSTIALSPRAQR